mgnify:CR=1 FL=1
MNFLDGGTMNSRTLSLLDFYPKRQRLDRKEVAKETLVTILAKGYEIGVDSIKTKRNIIKGLLDLSYVKGDQTVQVFDFDDSNLLSLENKTHMSVDDIGEEVLLSFGLISDMFLRSATVPIYRCNRFYWEHLHLWNFLEPKVPGVDAQYYEIEDANYLNEQTVRNTPIYNELLKTSIKGAAMLKILHLSEDLIGHYKSPFDTPMNQHVRKFRERFSSADWAQSKNLGWLSEIESNISTWIQSVQVENREEFSSLARWLQQGAEKFKNENKLGDDEYWLGEENRDDPIGYIDNLNQYANLQHMLTGFFERALNLVWDNLAQASRDLGSMASHIIDR